MPLIEMRIIALVTAFSSALMAQGPNPPFDNPPRIVFKVESEYSEEARRVHLEGDVRLKIIIGADGKPRDLRVVRSLGLGLDENAMAAVGKWKFQPGTKNGQVVAGPAQIEVNFRLLNKGSIGATRWHLARAEFHLPEGVSRPICEKVVPPGVLGDSDNASATLAFDIDEKGTPVNLRIEKSSDQGWARDVTDALSKWRFAPASQDGRPISVSCTMDFVRGKGE